MCLTRKRKEALILKPQEYTNAPPTHTHTHEKEVVGAQKGGAERREINQKWNQSTTISWITSRHPKARLLINWI